MRIIRIFGYATAAILLTALTALAGFWAYERYWSPTAFRLREATRTHEGRLGADDEDAGKALHRVGLVIGAGGDTFGFVSMPSFSPWYAVSVRLRPGDRDAQGAIVGVRQDDVSGDLTFSRVQTFAMPRADYLELAHRLGWLTDRWAGSAGNLCFDGTPIAFELTRKGHATSGVGNADCDLHYAAVRRVVEPMLFRFAPKPVAPVSTARQAQG
jgi:hypothetical protein